MAYADTLTGAGNIAEQWSKEFFAYGMKNMFFSRFIGKPTKLIHAGKRPSQATIQTDPNSLIQLKMELMKEAGEAITFPIIAPLTGHGRVATPAALTTGSLEDHEEGILNYSYRQELCDWGHATRDQGPMTRQQASWDWDTVARQILALWFGQAMDAATYSALAGIAYVGDDEKPADAGGTPLIAAAAPSRKVTGGMKGGTFTAKATDALCDDEEYMCLEMIDHAKYTAVSTEPIMRPIIIDGQPWYLMFISSGQAKDLRANAGAGTGVIWSDVQMNANLRGLKNPLFTNALGAYNGVLLFEYQRCQTRIGVDGNQQNLVKNAFDAGDVLPVATWPEDGRSMHRGLFCGAGAAVHAYGAKPTFIRKDFDYGRQHGLAVNMLVGVGKPVFNAVDYSVMVVDTAVK